MRCQTEGQRVRAYWKTGTPDGSRAQLLTLRLPLDNPAYGIAGTVGTDKPAFGLYLRQRASGPTPRRPAAHFQQEAAGVEEENPVV